MNEKTAKFTTNKGARKLRRREILGRVKMGCVKSLDAQKLEALISKAPKLQVSAR